jgi:hypothetical protein
MIRPVGISTTLDEARAAFAAILPADVDVTLYPCDE